MRILFALLLPFSTLLHAQDLSVPEDILGKLTTEVVITETDTFIFRVAYPDGYSADKEYDCMVGISGGNQSMKIVNYCYAAWFQSGYFKDHITILPVNRDSSKTNFSDYTPDRLQSMISAIHSFFPVKSDWMIVGTSNGGTCAFDMVALDPTLFKAIIVAPGYLEEDKVVDENWQHLDVILAYGEKDRPEWIKKAKETAKRLKKSVKSVQRVALQDQGHILPIWFNVDKFYDPYFLMER